MFPRKKLDIPNELLPLSKRVLDGRITRGPSNGHARACNHEFGVAKDTCTEGAEYEVSRWHEGFKLSAGGRIGAGIGDSHTSTHPEAPPHDGDPGVPRTKNKYLLFTPYHLVGPFLSACRGQTRDLAGVSSHNGLEHRAGAWVWYGSFHVHGCVAGQRNLRVDSPKRTSSIVMIQKRTTTWFSFHPLSS